MSKYQLTAEELIIIKLIFLAQESHAEYFRLFQSECPHSKIYDQLLSLQDKGIILKSSVFSQTEIKANDIIFNKIFLKNYLKYSYDLGYELFEAYPKLLYIDNRPIPLRNIVKNFNSFEDFAFAYGKAIKFDEEKHQEVLKLLRWGVENDIVCYNICEFVVSFKWEELKQMRDNGYMNSTYDTTTML